MTLTGIRLWLMRFVLRGTDYGVYHHRTLMDARAALWRLGIYTRRSGHLTNHWKAGKRVRRGVEHAVELLAKAEHR